MAFAELWLPIFGAGICIAWAIGAWYGGDKILATWLVFVGAVCLFLLATLQWQNAIRKEASEASETATAQFRAYVNPSDGDVVFHTDGRPTVSATIKNTGQTPAYNLTWRAKFVVANSADGPEFSFDPKAIGTPVMLPPGGTLSYRYTFPQWSAALDELLRKREVFIFSIGEIRYVDASNKQRFTNYRLISSGRFENGSGLAPGKFGAAADGNDSN